MTERQDIDKELSSLSAGLGEIARAVLHQGQNPDSLLNLAVSRGIGRNYLERKQTRNVARSSVNDNLPDAPPGTFAQKGLGGVIDRFLNEGGRRAVAGAADHTLRKANKRLRELMDRRDELDKK